MSITETCRDISELTPVAQTACNLFIQKCKEQGLNVLITETYRSQARQDYLYEQGRTRPGNKVTWTRSSRHTSRRAWDICKNVKGQEYSDNNFFKKCGDIAKTLNITWGGTWSTPDTPHFEVTENWKAPKGEDIDMEELKQLKENYQDYVNRTTIIINTMGEEIESLKQANQPKMVYNYIDDNMPEWAREAVQWCVDKGYIVGADTGLCLDDKDLKWCTILYRALS